MGVSGDSVAEMAVRIKQEAAERNLLVFVGRMAGKFMGPTVMWKGVSRSGEFLDLAVALGKPMVYMGTDVLTAEALIDLVVEHVETELTDEVETPESFFAAMGLSDEEPVRELLRLGREHYGQTMLLTVDWIHEGILHRLAAPAQWHVAVLARSIQAALLIDDRECEDEEDDVE